MIRIAACCCGKATIELKGDPVLNIVCHCENCKSRTGSAFGMSCYFADEQIVEKRGDMSIYEIDNADTEQKRYFCSVCGTTLYWKLIRFPLLPDSSKLTGVAGGCFSNQPLPSPTFSVQDESKFAWVELPNIGTTVRRK